MRILVALVVVVALGVMNVETSTVLAQSYQFQVVAQTADGFADLLYPSISNRGEVAFLAGQPDGSKAIYAGTAGALRVVAQTGTTAPGTDDQIVDLVWPPSINESGEVAFLAQLASDATAIYVKSENGIAVVATASPFAQWKLLRWPVINSS